MMTSPRFLHASLMSHVLPTKVVSSLAGLSLLALAACSGSVEPLEPGSGSVTPSATGGVDAAGPSTGGATATGGATPTGGATAVGGVTSTGGSTEPGGGEPQDPERLRDGCSGDGDFDLGVKGSTPEAWQGRAVLVAAYKNEEGAHSRVVRLSDRIDEGAFQIACEESLEENYEYPSVGVVVDVDGDGTCSSGDLGVQLQLYGWANEVLVDIAEADWTEVGSLHSPLGSPTDDFCAGYFADWSAAGE